MQETEFSLETYMQKKKKAEAQLAQAQQTLAKLKKEERKADTHFKILLGSWLIAYIKHCRKNEELFYNQPPSLENIIEGLMKEAADAAEAPFQIPRDLLEWIKLQDKAIMEAHKASERRKKRKQKQESEEQINQEDDSLHPEAASKDLPDHTQIEQQTTPG